MSTNTFHLLHAVNTQALGPHKSRFTIGPFHPGLGTTVGNALRRTLYALTEGYAVSNIQFEPTQPHEFASIEGVTEDIQEIILNLKKVALKKVKEMPEEVITIELKGQKAFKASDITKASKSFEAMEPDYIICHMEESTTLTIKLTITQGYGYRLAEDHKPEKQVWGSFPIDAIYSPIINIKFAIENTLVGKNPDYEEVVLEVETNGTIEPEAALKYTAQKLGDIFTGIHTQKVQDQVQEESQVDAKEINRIRIQKLLSTPLSELPLSQRVINSLLANGMTTLKNIVDKKVSDLLALPNFGKKCLEDLELFLQEQNLSLATEPK